MVDEADRYDRYYCQRLLIKKMYKRLFAHFKFNKSNTFQVATKQQ